MATVGELKAQIAGYLSKEEADFVANGEDLLLVALNNARLAAERKHDWEYSLKEVQVTVNPTNGVALSTAVLRSDGVTAASVKAVETSYWIHTDGDIPLTHYRKKNLAFKNREVTRKEMWNNDTRFRANSASADAAGYVTYQIAQQIYIHPAPSAAQNIALDAYCWMDAYTSDSDTDFFTVEGADYMLWAGIVKANHLVQKFIPREEGSLPPPIQEMRDAFDAMVLWDNFLVDGHSDPDLR